MNCGIKKIIEIKVMMKWSKIIDAKRFPELIFCSILIVFCYFLSSNRVAPNLFINPTLLGLSTQIWVDKPSFCEGLYYQK